MQEVEQGLNQLWSAIYDLKGAIETQNQLQQQSNARMEALTEMLGHAVTSINRLIEREN